MKKIIFVTAMLSLFPVSWFSQTGGRDSLYEGRNCRLVLFNGYEAEGIVESRVNDTVFFKTEIINLKVPVKDIKFVLNPGFGLPETKEEHDSLSREIIPEVKIDTSDECDVYLANRKVMKDVELIYLNDTTLRTVKEGRAKNINISDIRKVVFKPVAPFGKGFLAGAGFGFLAGFVPLAFARHNSEGYTGPGAGIIFGLILAIPSGLIGGVVGVLTSSTYTYLFDEGSTPVKTKRLKYLLEKHRK